MIGAQRIRLAITWQPVGLAHAPLARTPVRRMRRTRRRSSGLFTESGVLCPRWCAPPLWNFSKV
jgi:hypothetical protein